MKRSMIAAAVLCAGAGMASADAISYGDIVWLDGHAVEASLTGVAGDPAQGAKIVSSKKLGNCVACHEVAALPDVAFQGEIGPALDGAGHRWTEAQLRGILVNAKMVFTEDTLMPAFYKDSGFIRLGDRYTGKAYPADTPVTPLLDAQQIEDVVAYLATLN